jgi:hypothetical protein
MLDRLLHHATTVVTSGQPHRMREAKTRTGGRRTADKPRGVGTSAGPPPATSTWPLTHVFGLAPPQVLPRSHDCSRSAGQVMGSRPLWGRRGATPTHGLPGSVRRPHCPLFPATDDCDEPPGRGGPRQRSGETLAGRVAWCVPTRPTSSLDAAFRPFEPWTFSLDCTRRRAFGAGLGGLVSPRIPHGPSRNLKEVCATRLYRRIGV